MTNSINPEERILAINHESFNSPVCCTVGIWFWPQCQAWVNQICSREFCRQQSTTELSSPGPRPPWRSQLVLRTKEVYVVVDLRASCGLFWCSSSQNPLRFQSNSSSNRSHCSWNKWLLQVPSRLIVLFYSILYSHSRLWDLVFPTFNPWAGV